MAAPSIENPEPIDSMIFDPMSSTLFGASRPIRGFRNGGVAATTAILLAAVTLIADARAEPERPNILLIMADDMGVENFSCYGSEVYETPHIDRLAASGLRFEHAHSQPICTPSRVQIMTGLYNNRNYLRFGLLDPEAVTFANLLRDGGYKTVIAGKWQLGGGWEAPGNFGFDRYCLWQLNRKPSRYPNPGFEIDGEQVDFKNGEFGPDVLTDYLCEFFEAQEESDQPFFAYYPMVLPHWPFVPTPDHPDWDPAMWRDATREPGGYRGQKYWDAMVRYTDKMVGKLVAKLEETGQRENTLIIWTADNGTYRGIRSEFQGRTYRGGKGTTKDSGTHVGFVASWPGVIEAGRVSNSLVDFADILPTLNDVAGLSSPERTDGVSLLPVLKGRNDERVKEVIYCWYERNGVRDKASQHVRDRGHKLYADGRFYDVVEDPLENRNLAIDGVPEELAETHAKLKHALDEQVAVTRVMDPVIEAKRAAR
jgi:arylsulfatase A